MSNRQERIARKARQRAGLDAYVHTKPTSGTRPYETHKQVQERRRGVRAAREMARAVSFGLARAVRGDAP